MQDNIELQCLIAFNQQKSGGRFSENYYWLLAEKLCTLDNDKLRADSADVTAHSKIHKNRPFIQILK